MRNKSAIGIKTENPHKNTGKDSTLPGVFV